MATAKNDYFGKRLTPKESEAVVAELREVLTGLVDRWLFKGRFHRDLAAGTLPMEAIRVFWQNWYGLITFTAAPTSATFPSSSAIPSFSVTSRIMSLTR